MSTVLNPRTININGFDIPEPQKSALHQGTEYFVPALNSQFGNITHRLTWHDSDNDELYLKNGLVHLTEEAAQIHNAALLSFTSTIKE